MKFRLWYATAAAALAVALTACTTSNNQVFLPPPASNPFNFHTITNIGSIVDPLNGDKNPYGLAIAPVTAGLLTAGDLVVCNFNDSANVEGNGTTAVYIHASAGSTVHRFAQSASIKGCGSTSVLPDDRVSVTGKLANNVVIFNANGTTNHTFSGAPFNGPWGSTYATSATKPAIYVANANDGNLVRINVTGSSTYSTETIATGFSVNGGAPGSILAPYGMAYDPSIDALYIVETNSNKLIAIANVSSVPAGGITVSGGDSTFGGPSGSSAHVVLSGAPLSNPLGGSLLANGNIVVANSGNNLMIQVAPNGQVVGSISLDSGVAGALFSLAAAVVSAKQLVYFNDSNDDSVKFVGP